MEGEDERRQQRADPGEEPERLHGDASRSGGVMLAPVLRHDDGGPRSHGEDDLDEEGVERLDEVEGGDLRAAQRAQGRAVDEPAQGDAELLEKHRQEEREELAHDAAQLRIRTRGAGGIHKGPHRLFWCAVRRGKAPEDGFC